MVKTMKTPEFGRGGELSTIIGKGTVIKGNIKVRNSLRIDGKIIGNVTTSDEGAHFEGNCSMKDSVQKTQGVEKENGDK